MEKKKKTKLNELTRQIEMKMIVALNGLKEKGFKYKSLNQFVEDEDIEDVKAALLQIQDDIEEKAKRVKEMSKAKFLGIVRDKITGRYKRLLLKVDLSQLEGIEHDLVEIGENGTIFGVKIELGNDVMKNVITNVNDYEE